MQSSPSTRLWPLLLAPLIVLGACEANSAADKAASKEAVASETEVGNTNAAPSASDKGLSTEDRAAAMRAAGYELRRGKWMTTCEDEKTASSNDWYEANANFEDLNGDGTAEAIIVGGNTACFGMVATGFVVLGKAPAGWTTLIESDGIPDFYSRPDIAFPDIEIGGPGSHCFPFVRWNGAKYVAGGRSISGDICELRRTSSALPLPMGYYVHSVGCWEADKGNGFYVGYLGRDRFVTPSSGNFVSFKKTGASRYRQIERYDSEEGGSAMSPRDFVVKDENSFTTDGQNWSYCPTDQLPEEARLLDNPGFARDPTFAAVRMQK